MRFTFLLFAISCQLTLVGQAQLVDTQHQKIDSLFIGWNQPNHPGGVVGIQQKGKTVFHKAYGLASLEYLVPNTTGTMFNTASVSKQFTAMGIVLLHQEGKLSVDDDIRKYIPELPDFGSTITIRHMLHHTSGLRSLHALLGLAGWRGDDLRTNEDLYRLMEQQQDLNFTPGDEYLYCNTGFMYMAKIIETVTKEKFTDWMQQSIFAPLGMMDTYVEDQYNRVVTQNATSYHGSADEGFTRAVEYWDYVGSGNMHSTARDLLTWMSNFANPSPGWEEHFTMLQTLDNFNDGTPNPYAFGVNIGSFYEQRLVTHGGSIGGFRSNVITFPDKELSIVILTNFSSANPGQKTRAIAGILLGSEESAPSADSSVETIQLSKKALTKFEGDYWNNREKYTRRVYLKEDTLRYARSKNNESALLPISKNEFLMLGASSDLRVHFEEAKGTMNMSVATQNESPSSFYRYEATESNSDELTNYTGTFYSPELETSYRIVLNGDELAAHHTRHGKLPMKRVKKDVLEGEWPLSIVEYQRDDNGNIEGIQVSNGRVRNLWMKKQE
ncbi:MAG: serine hydrolase domain-containing protein [Cyclobacteriaceae bacterium]